MVIGSFTNIFMITFIHAKEAQALGISKAIFGKATLAGFPWTVIDPLIISLPLSAITLVALSLLTQGQDEKVVQKTKALRSSA